MSTTEQPPVSDRRTGSGGSAGPPPEPTAGGPPTTGGGPRRRTKLVAAGAALALLVAGGAGYALSSGGGEVEYQALNTAGSSPFTAPVGIDQVGFTAPAGAGGEQPGNAGGLFAQDPARPSCDGDALVNALSGDPAKGAAWAGVFGLSAAGIGSFVGSLTPVWLRSDTAVVDHGYEDGRFTSVPATLAAGTAVLINSYGEPTVKCRSGNPLTRRTTSTDPEAAAATGTTIDRGVTVINPAPVAITSNTFLDPATGGRLQVPGKPDPKPDPGPNPIDPVGTKPVPAPTPQAQASFTHDGRVQLPDGRIMLKNGFIVPFPAFPGGTKNPDGSQTFPDGTVRNINGTLRGPLALGQGRTLLPSGRVEPPLPAGITVKWLYNGDVMTVDGPLAILKKVAANGTVTEQISVLSPGEVRNPDGSITQPDGRIVDPFNPDPVSKVRPPVTLPGGGVLLPPGTNIPGPDEAPLDKALQANNNPEVDKLPEAKLAKAPGSTVALPDGRTATIVGADGEPVTGATVRPDGTVVGPDGRPVPGAKVVPDGGTATVAPLVGPNGEPVVPGGTTSPAGGGVADGSTPGGTTACTPGTVGCPEPAPAGTGQTGSGQTGSGQSGTGQAGGGGDTGTGGGDAGTGGGDAGSGGGDGGTGGGQAPSGGEGN